MLVQRFEPQGRRFTNFHYYLFCSFVRKFDHTLVRSCNALKDGSELSYSSFLLCSKVDSFSLRDFCSKLETNVEELSFWSASLEKLDQLPSGHKDKLLDSPLRTPLKVKDEVAKSSRLGNSRIPTYNSQTIPGATVGPEPIFMEHYKKRGHDKGTPQGCRRCGKDIADKLMKFTVGKNDSQNQCGWFVTQSCSHSVRTVEYFLIDSLMPVRPEGRSLQRETRLKRESIFGNCRYSEEENLL